MTEFGPQPQRRRRRRAQAPAGPPPQRPEPVVETAPAPVVPPPTSARSRPAGKPFRRGRGDGDEHSRGMGDLVGGGHSQLGVDGALRGRDVNRPTDEDLAEAEASLVIVRRNWKPPA